MLATEERQGDRAAVVSQRPDAPDADLVVARFVDDLDAAVNPGDDIVKPGAAAGRQGPADPFELVRSGAGEAAAHAFLIGG